MYVTLNTPGLERARDFQALINKKKFIDVFQGTASEILEKATKLHYYLSAGNFLVNMRNNEEIGGKAAIICDQQFLIREWLRAIPQIMNGDNSCVTVRPFQSHENQKSSR